MNEHQRFDELYQSLLTDGTLIHVSELLERAARLWPKNIIVRCMDEKITYGELYARSLQFAHKLRDLGVKKGERVIIFYENSIEFYIAYFGVWQAGGIVAPLNVFLHEDELLRIIEDAKPKVLIISDHLKERLGTHSLDRLPPIISTIDKKSRLPTYLEPIEREAQEMHEVAALLYTSGTTGFPKAVMLSSYNIIINAVQGISRFNFSPDEKVFCPLPLFHSLPQNVCVWSTTLLGSTAIIAPKIERKAIYKGLAARPTIIIVVPALYGLFCMMKTLNFKRVRMFFSGGDALSDKIRSFFELIYGRKICNGYGLTETSPFLSVDDDDFTMPTNSVGRPLERISCSIRNSDGKELPRGQIGVLWVKGDNIMLGYYNAPEATAAILQDGWLNTGDLAYVTRDGKIVLAGRERDLISNKGLKIYPQEVENILLSHKDVLQAGVIGVLENGEEIPVAFIASKEPNTEKLISELKNLCARHLAPYKIPRRFYIKKDLPVTTTGKVDKKVLRKELEAATK